MAASGYITKKRFEREVAEAKARILGDQRPRCGTCGVVCDPMRNPDLEGYSPCCNDRIEYPGEWADDDYSVTLWAIENVRWAFINQGKTINPKWIVEAETAADEREETYGGYRY